MSAAIEIVSVVCSRKSFKPCPHYGVFRPRRLLWLIVKTGFIAIFVFSPYRVDILAENVRTKQHILSFILVYFKLSLGSCNRKRSTNDSESSVVPEIRLCFRIFCQKWQKWKLSSRKPEIWCWKNATIKTGFYWVFRRIITSKLKVRDNRRNRTEFFFFFAY